MGNSLSSGTIEINNFEELLEFAEAGVKPGQKQLKLSPELGVLVIHVEGEGYGNFIPGEQLRSLWQIQEDFFRLAAYALHGTTALSVKITFATLSVLHGVVKHAIFAGVYR